MSSEYSLLSLFFSSSTDVVCDVGWKKAKGESKEREKLLCGSSGFCDSIFESFSLPDFVCINIFLYSKATTAHCRTEIFAIYIYGTKNWWQENVGIEI